MAGIFISYRQADAAPWAMTLRDDLARAFGNDQVFLDKDTLHAGNWRDQINQALDRCAVVLVVIGPRWLTTVDAQHQPRLDLPDDVHRQEVALALNRPEVTVIPVLVEETPMPRAEQLPEDLRHLCDQQAYKIGDTHIRRKADMEVLIQNIQSVGGLKARAETTDASEAESSTWLKPDITVISIAAVLTICAATLAYLSNTPFVNGEPFVLLLVFYGLAVGVRRLWRIRVERRRGGT
ncbi:MAG: toll/interleukin-1 receptor domain-containing protein [Nitrospira sp.]|nr:toll/interleukin-1 receptor domain-containing protein [Nitrospira sp.]